MQTNTRDLGFVNFNGQEMNFVNYNGALVYESWKKLLASGIPPLTLFKCKQADLVDYKIYGESVQDGTPTPNTPVEVESVGEKTKNLIPYPYYMNVANPYYGITWKVNNDGSITLNGTATGRVNLPLINVSVPISLKAGTYTISGNNLRNSEVRLWFREVGSGTVLTSSYNGNAGTLTLTKDSDMYVYITVNSGVTLENVTIYPLLEESEVATEFELYGYKIPVRVRGKNHLNPEFVTEYNSIAYDGKLQVSDWWQSNYPLARVYSIPVQPNTTYSLYAQYVNDNVLAEYGVNDNNLSKVHNILPDNRNYTFTTSADTYYLKLLANPAGQLELGDKITEYEPYIELTTNVYLKEPLRKLGSYADYIDFETKKVIRNVTEYVVPKDINWDSSLGDAYNLIRFIITKEQIVGQKVPFTAQKCNYALCDEQTTKDLVQGVSIYYSASLGGTYWRARNTTDFSSPAEYRAFVKACSDNGKPFKVYFDSYKPTEEDIELPNIPTIKGTNIIEVDTTIKPSNMEVTYLGKK